MEANVLLFKCTKSKRAYGVRIQKMRDGDWYRTWAFKLSEGSAKREGYDRSVIKGNLYATEEYPGCPYCGCQGFVMCGHCQKIACWDGESSYTCPWCGTKSNISTAEDMFTVTANGD